MCLENTHCECENDMCERGVQVWMTGWNDTPTKTFLDTLECLITALRRITTDANAGRENVSATERLSLIFKLMIHIC